ncbi:MAG: cobalt-precorrin-5B (C(1))-methyltransferase [Pseudomonadota bacterium]
MKRLRTGFSTGAAATAAATAALETLLTGQAPDRVVVGLPEGGSLDIAVRAAVRTSANSARASVVKDGGDDPDATHRAEIVAEVELTRPEEAGNGDPEELIDILGGTGVGRVTRPGLPVPVGQPAINPVPLVMIKDGLRRAWSEHGPSNRPLRVRAVISVPEGERLAPRTLNPRLGILGGISILGTTGLVKPFSHEAYTSTIESGLSVARAMGLDEVVLTTGGRSEKWAMARRPDLPEVAFIQIADYFGFALEEVKKFGFSRLGLVCFFGKAVKQARGLACTHAHQSAMDLGVLSQWFAEAGAAPALVKAAAEANTARQVLDILAAGDALGLVDAVGRRLEKAIAAFLGPGVLAWVRVIDFDGAVLYSSDRAGAA